MTKKAAINEKLKEIFVYDGNLDEDHVAEAYSDFYKEATTYYSSWSKVLRNNQITKKKRREREKFMIYMILKQRYEKHGEEALRKKNVQPEEFKKRVLKAFKSLQDVLDIVEKWNPDRVLYEMHASFLSGTTVRSFSQEEPDLYKRMMREFGDYKTAIERYDALFGMPTIDPDLISSGGREQKPAPSNEKPQKINDDLLSMMMKLSYIEDEKDVQYIVQANQITKEQVITYLFQQMAEAKIQDKQLSDLSIKDKDPAMHFAIQAHYGSFQEAISEMKQALVDVG
ncbi:hypothetical protein IMZ31_21215 (plasmid) [Pontibacillus sp. ALD_SL1]|uniref:hypothetical protein n=1 Tax=Pontibacillus sp. ALD_SL1 TaxID=2777185 RepID=UPI001A97C3C1|nr:hypothetical protein [Pontibacillus sp. ALD_SL1]QST03071.1 hypothetical protein IMZ31_21215 [Pontibacillus sp. ALD_SL1]